MATVQIPTILRELTHGQKVVSATGADLRHVIDDLEARFPGLGARLCEPDGRLRGFINAYVDDRDVRFASGLDTPVGDSDEIHFLPAVAGG